MRGSVATYHDYEMDALQSDGDHAPDDFGMQDDFDEQNEAEVDDGMYNHYLSCTSRPYYLQFMSRSLHIHTAAFIHIDSTTKGRILQRSPTRTITSLLMLLLPPIKTSSSHKATCSKMTLTLILISIFV